MRRGTLHVGWFKFSFFRYILFRFCSGWFKIIHKILIDCTQLQFYISSGAHFKELWVNDYWVVSEWDWDDCFYSWYPLVVLLECIPNFNTLRKFQEWFRSLSLSKKLFKIIWLFVLIFDPIWPRQSIQIGLKYENIFCTIGFIRRGCFCTRIRLATHSSSKIWVLQQEKLVGEQ